MKTITASKAKTITKPGMYRADVSLYLLVKPSGRKTWVQRIVVNGRRRDLGLGPLDLVTIDKARKKALENRIANYEDMLNLDGNQEQGPATQVQRKPKTPTFEKLNNEYLETKKLRWKESSRKNRVSGWQGAFNNYASHLLKLPVDTITKKDVLAIVEPIWATMNPTAKTLRRQIREVLSYAQSKEYVRENVAGDAIDGALPKGVHKTKNNVPVDYRHLPDAVKAIEDGGSSPSSRLGLLFMIHTGTRPNETTGARWEEIDLEGRVWHVPEERMKPNEAHSIPLSTGAMAILSRARSLDNGKGYVFPSEKTGVNMDKDAMNGTWSKLRDRFTPEGSTAHGFRSTFKTWVLNETNHDWTTSEKALSHKVGNAVAQAYDHADQLEKRRSLMQDYSDHING